VEATVLSTEAITTFFPDIRSNQLLGGLPGEFLARHRRDFKMIFHSTGEVLDAGGGREKRMLFPLDCVVSLVGAARDGAHTEYAMVGREGAVGLSLFLGGGIADGKAIIERSGAAAHVPARLLSHEDCECGPLYTALLHYTHAFIVDLSRTAVCNSLHSVEQRLCRWLLIAADRMQATRLRMTHERLAMLLGVSRESVSIAAGRLQRDSVIRYARGRISIDDRAALESFACDCYSPAKSDDRYRRDGSGSDQARPVPEASEATRPPLRDLRWNAGR